MNISSRRVSWLVVTLLCAMPAAVRAQAPAPAATSAARAGIDTKQLDALLNKRLFEMKPAEVDRYLAYLQNAEPDLRKRVAALARKNIGQPYKLFAMGEFPFEITDPQPMFSLEKSDCLLFTEHTYAMALSAGWAEFFWMLQRIRYKDGVIGVVTRNHYTEADWNPANAWLLTDISRELAGASVATYSMQADRAKLLRDRYQLSRDIPVQTVTDAYVPKNRIAAIENQLQEGDMVNVVSARNGETLVSHTGLVVLGPGGKRHMIHSAEPMVREETFASFIQRAEQREARSTAQGKSPLLLQGFKFLRLNDNPVVPPMKPQLRPDRP